MAKILFPGQADLIPDALAAPLIAAESSFHLPVRRRPRDSPRKAVAWTGKWSARHQNGLCLAKSFHVPAILFSSLKGVIPPPLLELTLCQSLADGTYRSNQPAAAARRQKSTSSQ